MTLRKQDVVQNKRISSILNTSKQTAINLIQQLPLKINDEKSPLTDKEKKEFMSKVNELRERVKTEDDQEKIKGILNEIRELSIEINKTISETDRLKKQNELPMNLSLEIKKEIYDKLGLDLGNFSKSIKHAIPIMEAVDVNI